MNTLKKEQNKKRIMAKHKERMKKLIEIDEIKNRYITEKIQKAKINLGKEEKQTEKHKLLNSEMRGGHHRSQRTGRCGDTINNSFK